MTKTYNFKTKNNINTFRTNNTNYSKILDNIILSNVIKKNDYLFTDSTCDYIYDSMFDDKKSIIISSNLKSDAFTKATKFLANYKKYKNIYKTPFIFGKMYTLNDGTPIVFYDDEIQIGFDTYSYDSFNNISFLNKLTDTTKNIIINIYTTSTTNIDINIL